MATQSALTKGVKQAWNIAKDGAYIQVGFGCDRLGQPQEIILQGGGGHGGTLDLTRLRRSEDGKRWDLLVLRASSGYLAGDNPQAGAYRGQLSAKKVSRALDTARAALVLEAEEIAPPNTFGGSYGSSSADFHAFVRIIDGNARSRELAFVGYMGSSEQALWIPAQLAHDTLAALVDTAQLLSVPHDTDSREFYMERFAEAQARNFYGQYGWWVRERLVMMASTCATPDLVPALARLLCGDELKSSEGRTRADALAAIFALIGHEETITLDGLEHVADDFVAPWRLACDAACEP